MPDQGAVGSERALERAAIGPAPAALALHLVVFPLPLVAPPIAPEVDSAAILLVVGPLAVVVPAPLVAQLSLTVPLVVLPLACVGPAPRVRARAHALTPPALDLALVLAVGKCLHVPAAALGLIGAVSRRRRRLAAAAPPTPALPALGWSRLCHDARGPTRAVTISNFSGMRGQQKLLSHGPLR